MIRAVLHYHPNLNSSHRNILEYSSGAYYICNSWIQTKLLQRTVVSTNFRKLACVYSWPKMILGGSSHSSIKHHSKQHIKLTQHLGLLFCDARVEFPFRGHCHRPVEFIPQSLGEYLFNRNFVSLTPCNGNARVHIVDLRRT